MNNNLAKKIFFFATKIKGENIEGVLKNLVSNEYLNRDELEKMKINKAKKLLLYAKEKVPFYRENYKIDSYRLTKMDVDEFKNYWLELPLLSKSDVIDNSNKLISNDLKNLRWSLDKTSGSTGTPLVFKVDSVCWEVRHSRDLQFKMWHGIKIGDRYALFWGEHWSNKNKLKLVIKDILLNRKRISAFKTNSDYLEECYRRILRFKPTYFFGYPSAIFDFCVFLKDKGIELYNLKLKAVLTTAEPLRDYQRKLISQICNCKVFSQYGGAEQGVAAAECPYNKMHIFSDTVWLEPFNGLDKSGLGECVATDLQLFSMPLIRYRTGDEVEFDDGLCECKRGYPLLRRVEGRSGKDIILPNGKKINANLPSYIFKEIASKGIIRRYRFVDKKDGLLYLFLVPAGHLNDKILNIIERETKKAFGEDLKLKIEIKDSLENLPNAKHKDYVVL